MKKKPGKKALNPLVRWWALWSLCENRRTWNHGANGSCQGCLKVTPEQVDAAIYLRKPR